jgi:hypothetical protein
MAGANSGRNRQPLDWLMIQVAAFIPGRRAGHPMRAKIEIEMGNPPADDLSADDLLAGDLAARGTAARIVGYDWNRNSEAKPLKSSTL